MADEGATWDDLALRLTANFIDYEDYPTSGSLLVEVRDGVGTLELPRGKQGAQGPPGRAAAPFEGVVSIATAGQLPASPTEAQKKQAYVPRDTGALWAWDQAAGRWVDVGLFRGPAGPAGAAPRIMAGGIAATDPGTDPDQWFEEISPGVYQWHMTVPRGDTGPPGPEGAVGPAASIASASDVDVSGGVDPGDSLISGDDGVWRPARRAVAGPWGQVNWIEPTQDYWTDGDDRLPVARVEVPGQLFDWRPLVFAGALVEVDGPGGATLEVEASGTEGGGNSGVCGSASTLWSGFVSATPFSANQATAAMSAVIPAGVASTVTMYVRSGAGGRARVRKLAGPGRSGNLQVWAIPAVPK